MIVTFIIYLMNIYLIGIWIDFNFLLINELIRWEKMHFNRNNGLEQVDPHLQET